MDDKLDFVQDSLIFGKPTGQDLKLGLATAPVLFASEIFPHLKDLFALNASDCDFTPEKMKSVRVIKVFQFILPSTIMD